MGEYLPGMLWLGFQGLGEVNKEIRPLFFFMCTRSRDWGSKEVFNHMVVEWGELAMDSNLMCSYRDWEEDTNLHSNTQMS